MKRQYQSLLLKINLVILIVNGFGFCADNPFNIYSKISKYDSLLTDGLLRYKIPGAAAAIIQDHKIIYKETFGVRNIYSQIAVNDSTIFRLASLSKGFTSTLTGMLVEENLLNWDSKVIDFLPDLKLSDPAATENLTISHLLSQTSGLPSYAGTDKLENNISYQQLIQDLAIIPLVSMPGEQYNYQNVVFSLTGDILAEITNQSFEKLLNTYIFKPLKLRHTSIGMDAYLQEHNHAFPHIKADSIWIPTTVKPSYYNIPPAAGINASIDDMIIWVKAMLGAYPQIIPDNIRKETMKAHIPTEKASRYFGKWENLGQTWYGLGWRVFEFDEHTLVYHGGYVQGFRAEIALDLYRNIGIVVLMNAASPLADNCIPMFFDLFVEKQQ